MKSLASWVAVTTLALCACSGGTKANHPDAGHHCDSGVCGAQTCSVDADCVEGKCTNNVCVIQCAVDADCHSATAECNSRGQCVPKQVANASTGSNGASNTSSNTTTTGTSGTTGIHITTTTSSGTTHATSGSSGSSSHSTSTTGTSGTTHSSTSSNTTGSSGTTFGTSSGTTGHPATSTTSSSTTNTTGTTGTSSGPTTTSSSSTTTSSSSTTTTSSSTSTSSSSSSTTTNTTTTTSSSSTGTTGTTSTSAGGCTQDSQCNPPTTVCNTANGACVAGCLPGTCPSGQGCDLTGGHCLPLTGSGALGATCTNFDDCASGDCVTFFTGSGSNTVSECTQACSASAQCPLGFVCLDYGGSGLCRNANEVFNGQFVPGNGVVGASCTVPSGATSQCHSLYTCFDPTGSYASGDPGTCTDSCSMDSDCNSTSASGDVCYLGTDGTTRASYCVSPSSLGAGEPDICCLDSDCGFGMSCTGTGFECDIGIGTDGTCQWNGDSDLGASCGADYQCAHDYCNPQTGTCTQPCCGWADCPGANTCVPQMGSAGEVYKICQPYPSGSTIGPGGACDVNSPSQCLTGYCFPKDPLVSTGGAGSGYCSQPCCTNATCPGGETCELLQNGFFYPDGGSAGDMGFCVLR